MVAINQYWCHQLILYTNSMIEISYIANKTAALQRKLTLTV